MSKVENFIEEKTNYGSSDIIGFDNDDLPIYQPWLTPDDTRNAIEIARKEVIEQAIEWLRKNWRDYINTDKDGVVCFGHWQSDFRKAMSKN